MWSRKDHRAHEGYHGVEHRYAIVSDKYEMIMVTYLEPLAHFTPRPTFTFSGTYFIDYLSAEAA